MSVRPANSEKYWRTQRSSSPQSVRSIDGHGCVMTSLPPELRGTSLHFSSTTFGTTPKNGRVPEPGFVGVTPGSGEIMIEPVSVCHHVSTIGHFFLPIIV